MKMQSQWKGKVWEKFMHNEETICNKVMANILGASILFNNINQLKIARTAFMIP